VTGRQGGDENRAKANVAQHAPEFGSTLKLGKEPYHSDDSSGCRFDRKRTFGGFQLIGRVNNDSLKNTAAVCECAMVYQRDHPQRHQSPGMTKTRMRPGFQVKLNLADLH
jgi:hypothetical protein